MPARSTTRSRRPRERGRRPRARLRLGPDGARPLRRPAAARARGRGAPRPSRDAAPDRRRPVGGDAVKPVWLVFAVALAAFLVWRRRRARADAARRRRPRRRRPRSSTALGVVQLPEPRAAARSTSASGSANWTYLLVGALAFLETGAFVGLIAPGETALLLGGLVAGQGEIDVAHADRDRLGRARSPATSRASTSAGGSAARFLVKHGPKVADHRGAPASRSRASSTATAARRSSSGASSASCARSRRSWPARRACRCGASCPTTSSAPACGARPSSCSATSSGRASASSSTTPKKGALALGAVIVARGRDRVARPLAARRRTTARRMRAWIERQARAAGAAAAGRACCAPVLRTTRRPGALRVGPRHAGRPRARAHDAAGGRRASGAFVFVWRPRRASSRTTACSSGDARVAAAGRPPAHRRAGRRREGRHRAGLAAGGDRARGRSAAACSLLAPRAPRARSRSSSASRSPTPPCTSPRTPSTARGRRARSSTSTARPIPSGHAAYAVTWVAVAVALSRALPDARLALRVRHRGDRRSRAAVGLTPDLPARALPLRRRRRVGRWAPRSSRCAASPRWSSATCGTMPGRPTPTAR